MSTMLIKKKEFEIVENIDEHLLKVSRDGITYYAYLLGHKTRAYDNFTFAYKRLSNCNVPLAKKVLVDKKLGIIVTEIIEGKTVFEELLEDDLPDAYFEQAFLLNWYCRTSGILLDFNPKNFIMKDNRLYYTTYTFDKYSKDLDFSTTQLKYWFYTKEFRQVLIDEHIDIDKSRIKTDYEMNKILVLKVVQFYK